MAESLTPEEAQTIESFDAIAEQWNQLSPAHWKDRLWYRYTDRLPQPASIVDLGCGTGRDAAFFREDGIRYVGIDLSFAMLRVASRNNPEANTGKEAVSFLRMSMYELGFRDRSFDGFWATASLLHIPRERLPLVLSGVRDLLKPRGIGFISVPFGDSSGMYEGWSDQGHPALCVCWDPEQLISVLKTSGFSTFSCEVLDLMVLLLVEKDA